MTASALSVVPTVGPATAGLSYPPHEAWAGQATLRPGGAGRDARRAGEVCLQMRLASPPGVALGKLTPASRSDFLGAAAESS